jgi:hypothetical protein
MPTPPDQRTAGLAAALLGDFPGAEARLAQGDEPGNFESDLDWARLRAIQLRVEPDAGRKSALRGQVHLHLARLAGHGFWEWPRLQGEQLLQPVAEDAAFKELIEAVRARADSGLPDRWLQVARFQAGVLATQAVGSPAADEFRELVKSSLQAAQRRGFKRFDLLRLEERFAPLLAEPGFEFLQAPLR